MDFIGRNIQINHRLSHICLIDHQKMTTHHLVITADDLGYSRERNEGIMACFKATSVTRASLMVNASAAEHAVSLAKACQMPIGLHLNLSEGIPVSAISAIPTLVTKAGFMHSKMDIRKHNTEGQIDYKQVQTEIEVQIEKFKELTGKLPPYVDGHQHVHILPGIRDIFAETLEKYGIEETRLPVEERVPLWSWLSEDSRSFYQGVVQDAQESRLVFKKHSIRFPDGFVGMGCSGENMSLERLEEMICERFDELKAHTGGLTVELMVHPGYPTAPDSGGCGQGPDLFAQSKDRQYELDILVSDKFINFCNGYRKVCEVGKMCT